MSQQQRLSSCGREPDQSFFFLGTASSDISSVRENVDWECEVLSGIEMGEWITLETTGAVWAGEAVERARGLGTTVEGDEVEEIRLPARHIPSNCGLFHAAPGF
jgi:hypothetical protein